MKKFFSLLLMSVLCATSVMAKDVVFDFAANPWGLTVATKLSTETNIEGLKEDVVTISCGDYATTSGLKVSVAKMTGMTTPALCAGANAGIVITADEGYEIQQVDMYCISALYAKFNPQSSDVNGLGTISQFADGVSTWTPNEGHTGAQSLDFKATSYRITKMVVTVSSSEGGNNTNPDVKPEAKETTRLLYCTSTYGDQLGEVSESTCTAKKFYYYDKDLNVQAVVNNKTERDGLIYTPVDYNSYRYDANGFLTEIKAYQYGAFEYLQRGVKESATSSTYKYNDKGQLIQKKEATLITDYEYDEDGNIVKESFSTGKTVVYSGFIGKNKYTKAVSTHTNGNAEAEYYDEVVSYDVNGNKTDARRVYNRDNSYILFKKEYGHHVGDFLSYEKWEYDEDGILVLYTKAVQLDESTGEPIMNTKTVYTPVDGDKNTIKRETFDARYVDDEVEGSVAIWSRRGTPFIDEYREFKDMKDLCDLEIEAKVSESEMATALVTFALPKLAEKDNNMHINVYRDGEFVATIPVMTITSNVNDYNITLNETTGKMTYHDNGVKNGYHEYMITAVASNMPEAAPGFNGGVDDDPTGDNMGVMPLMLTEFCASNKASVDMNTALPKAVNLVLNAKTAGSNNTTNSTIGFEYEEGFDAPEYGFVESFLVVNGGGYPDDPDTDANAKTSSKSVHQLTVALANGATSAVQVVTRYKLGIVLSEVFSINPSTAVPTGISELNAEMKNGALLFDLDGRQVNKAQKGVYIRIANGKATKVLCK